MDRDAIETVALGMRRERAFAPLLLLFLVSGATGLTYQTVWARELHLVFGTSTLAIATVLASFMGGMALGGAVLGRVADRVRRPLRIYGVLEVGIGLYALAFPYLLAGEVPLYLSLWARWEPSQLVFGLVQFSLAFAALVLPTAAMGATLPLLARFTNDQLGDTGDRVGTLYGVNTAGAVLGTWLCGFVLLPELGLSMTNGLAATANLSLGAGAILLGRWVGESEPAPEAPTAWDGRAALVAASLALAGFASLSYEVAWTRLLALMLGASTYAFSLMLVAFLVGIALGGKLGGGLADRAWRRGGAPAVLSLLAAVELGVGGSSWLLTHAYSELPFWYVGLYDLLGADGRVELTWAMSLVLSGLIMTPPAVLMGVAFPVAVRAISREGEGLGAPVGRLYAWNTVGSMFGALVAGFFLLPALWVKGTVALAVGVNLLAAAVLIFAARRAGARPNKLTLATGLLALAVLAVRPTWDPLVMTAGMYKYVSSLSDRTREGVMRYAVEQYDLLYYAEGLSSVVTVAANRDTQNMWLANNGKVEASTTVDMPTQILVSLLPFQFVDEPREVLVIGLASGITAGAVTLIDEVTAIDVVELEPAIVPAARLFDAHNYGVLDDPRVHLHLNDGRNHLLLAAPGSFDVVVSEPSNPWISGVSNLFTEEFFRLGKSRLKEGGVWGQWVQLYGMDPRDMKTLLATFASVYDYVAVYATVQDADLVMVGSDRPLDPTPEAAERLLAGSERLTGALGEIGLVDPMDVVALFQLDREHIVELTGEAILNTDDNMRIEYRAPLNLHVSTQERNYAALIDHRVIPMEAIGPYPERLAALAEAYQRRGDPVRAITAMAAAAYMAQEPEVRETYLARAEAWQAELEATFED
ncbi:MAG: fused MFS/spermidine synthase [Deltaproteobacteria bacterium]|nr:fused MFS/spermidine synthase [Deltaproteobacteria bacterium]